MEHWVFFALSHLFLDLKYCRVEIETLEISGNFNDI